MIRGHPHRASCLSCGNFRADDAPCRICGYQGPRLPAGATFLPIIGQRQIPVSMSGTLTFSASSSTAIDGLSIIEKSVMESDLKPEERIQYRSYIGLAQQIIIDQAKKRRDEYPEHIEQFKEKISEYEKYIDENKGEPCFQTFFKTNPNFLIPDQVSTIPKPNYGGEFKPDFMIEDSTSYHWIIEIEKPGKKLFTKKNRPRAGFTEVEQQIRDYVKWARDNIQFLKCRDWPRLNQENMRGILLIGKRADLSPDQESALQAMNHDRRTSYQIKTFDDILTENKAFLKNLERT